MEQQTRIARPKKRVAIGSIVEVRANGLYRVELEDGLIIQAHIGSTMKKFSVRILTGDDVVVELSPFDISRGKIVQKKNALTS